jgi:hypothetical protein
MRNSARETLRRFSLEALDPNLRAAEKNSAPAGRGIWKKPGRFELK